MLRLGQVLVTLVGIAAVLLSALVAWAFLADPRWMTYDAPTGWLFAVFGVAMLVGTVAIILGSAWGAALIALGTAGMLVWAVPQDDGRLVLAVAPVLAIAVAIGLARDKARRGELTWRG